ncbi:MULTISPECIES: hypothetical protein [Enterococcus]|uniref:Uncharacterized protein n=1 Tax=Enterococcus alishanensis TaxID=1303817 RepID=A0ABS6T9L2_9ENTE|nr:hypothetical protein [Enterococcus alishanensis]MBV7389580.1 hypothetical protein [Enterococcus alishanensis]
MLIIYYFIDDTVTKKAYQNAADFIGAQLKEVPDLEDYYRIDKVILADQELTLKNKTIGGLFDHLNK